MMNHLKKGMLLALAAVMLLTAGCGAGETAPTTAPEQNVASAADTAPVEDVVQAWMTPIYGNSLKDGTYSVTVDSSSSMFSITQCELTVENGEMTAVMHMGGTGYLHVYMGTAQAAAEAGEEAYIPYEEAADGTHSFTVPVEALDAGISCAAYSKKKELWYDRTLVFRADSLPMEAFQDGAFATAQSLGLEDGSYTVEVRLEGGSGKASVESPAKLRVEGGQAYATLVWSSSNYDYMKVNDQKFDPVNTEGNATFEIPVVAFDWKVPVLADTTAMSTPHEIEYTLYFDSATIVKAE